MPDRTTTPGIPFPTSTAPIFHRGRTLPWPAASVAEFDRRATLYGADQRQATTILLCLDGMGIRDLDRYTRKWTAEDFQAWVEHAASEYVDPIRYRRGDVLNVGGGVA